MVQHVQLGPGPGVELGDEHLKQLQVRSLALSSLGAQRVRNANATCFLRMSGDIDDARSPSSPSFL